MLILVFSGCIKRGDNIATFNDEPAIYDYYSFFRPAIETRFGETLLAPELENESFIGGELLWVDFEINYDKQPYSDALTATILAYQQIYSTYVTTGKADETAEDGYDAPIASLLDIKNIEKMLFFWFGHKAPQKQTFGYKMFYDPDDTSSIPTLYIKAQKTNEETGTGIDLKTCYGFDLSSFLNRYEGSEEVKINIKYCTGSKDGVDEYRSIDNPITWVFKVD